MGSSQKVSDHNHYPDDSNNHHACDNDNFDRPVYVLEHNEHVHVDHHADFHHHHTDSFILGHIHDGPVDHVHFGRYYVYDAPCALDDCIPGHRPPAVDRVAAFFRRLVHV